MGDQIGLHGICVLDTRVRYDILSDLDRNVLSELLKPLFFFGVFYLIHESRDRSTLGYGA